MPEIHQNADANPLQTQHLQSFEGYTSGATPTDAYYVGFMTTGDGTTMESQSLSLLRQRRFRSRIFSPRK